MIAVENSTSALTAFGPQMMAILPFAGAGTPQAYRDCIDTARTVASLRGIELGLPDPDRVDSKKAVRRAIRGAIPRFRESFDRGLREMTTSGDILRATIPAKFDGLNFYALYRNGLVTREIAMSFLNSLAHRCSNVAGVMRMELAKEVGVEPQSELVARKKAAFSATIGLWSPLALYYILSSCSSLLFFGCTIGIAILIPPTVMGITTFFQDRMLMKTALPPDSRTAELRDRVRIMKEDATSLEREADRIAASWF